MRDVLIGGGGVRAARVGSDLEDLPCAPVVIIGPSGSKDPLGGSPVDAMAIGPTDGLWLVDVFPVEPGAGINSSSALISTWSASGPATAPVTPQRVALLCEVPLSNPPALLAPITLLASTCVLVGSEVEVCVNLHRYVNRLMVLRTGTLSPPLEDFVGYATSRSASAEHARRAATAAQHTAAQLRLPWPVALPQLRVIIAEPPTSSSSPSGKGLAKSSLADAVAGTSPAEIDALIRGAAEAIFSSVVITRCRDVDAGTVTRDVVVHAPPRRLQSKGFPLSVKAWLGITASAYSRLHGWRHIAGRSTTDEVCTVVADAVEEYRNEQQQPSTANTSTAEPGAALASNIAAAHREAVTFATNRQPDVTVHDTSTGFLLAVDHERRRQDASSVASARDRTERALRQELDAHWKTIASIPKTTAHDWIDGVTRTLREFRASGGQGAANGNRAVVNAALVDVLLQWALPNASAASRVATDALLRQLHMKSEEIQRLTTDVRTAESTHATRTQLEHYATLAAEADNRARLSARQLEQLQERVTTYVKEHTAATEAWKRRFAAREFMASNVGGTSATVTSTSVAQSPSRSARFGIPAANNNTSGLSAANTTANAAFDERAVKAELQVLYDGFDELALRASNFGAEIERLNRLHHASASAHHPETAHALSSTTPTPDASAIHIDPRGAAAMDIRAARAAATRTSTHQGFAHVLAPPPTRSLNAPTLTPTSSDVDNDDDDSLLAAQHGARRGFVPTVPTSAPHKGTAKFIALMSPNKHDHVDHAALLSEYGGASVVEVEALRSALDKATAALAALQTTHDQQRDGQLRMEEERHQLHSRIDEDTATIKRLMNDNTLLRTEINRLLHCSNEADRLKNDCESLEYRLRSHTTTIEAFSKDKQRLEHDLDDVRAARDIAEQRLREVTQELASARETANASALEIQDLRDALYACQSAKSLAEHNVNSLSTELAVVRAEFRETEGELRNELANLEARRSEVHTLSLAHQARIVDLEKELTGCHREVEHLRAEAAAHRDQFEASEARMRQSIDYQQQALDAALQREQQASAAHANAYHEFTRALVERDALKAGLEERDRRVDRVAKSMSLLRDENNLLRRQANLTAPHHSTSLSRVHNSTHHSSHYTPHSPEWYAAPVHPLARAATSQPRPLPAEASHALEPSIASSAPSSLHVVATHHPPHYHHTDPAYRLYSAPLPLPKLADELLSESSPAGHV